MLFLIYGSNGWIGKQVIKILKQYKNINVICGKERVNNKEKIEQEIKKVKPTHIMSFIGRTHGRIGNKNFNTIDYLEQSGKIYENVRDNLFSSMILAMMCKKYNIHLTYLGTGCIFNYNKEHPYGKEINGFTEDSKPNFFGSSYSIVKGFTDELMHLFNETVLNIRIRMPITADNSSRNFITKITTYKKICSIPNSMSVLPDLIPIIIKMAIKNNVGTINLVNPGLISHNEILQMYKEIVDPSFTWENFSLKEQAEVISSERSNNYLDTTQLETMYPHINNIKISVREILMKMKNSYII